MRARALRIPRSQAGGALPRRPSTTALVYLRGREADARLRERVAERARARPVLGELAEALFRSRGHRALGFRCVGDWSRERLGLEARTVREWARVWKGLGELPRLRGAVLAGEVSWTVAGEVAFRAPPEVARLFRAMVGMLGLEALLDHAIGTWLGMRRRGYAVFDRDGWRCQVPGCRARRGLHAHHVRFRSQGGGDETSNLVTLCVAHHQYFVHAGLVRIRGRAPDGLVFEMGVGTFGSGDVKLAPG